MGANSARAAVGADPFQPGRHFVGFVAPIFQLGQGSRELHRRNQRQPFPIEQAEQQLEHVLAHRILPAGKEDAGIVPGRGRDPLAGIQAAAVGHDRQHQSAVADVVQILDQAQGAAVERIPVVETAMAEGVERLRCGEVFDKQRPIEIAGQQPAAGRRIFGRRPTEHDRAGFGPGERADARRGRRADRQHANLAIHRPRILPSVGDQHHRRLAARPEDDPMMQQFGGPIGIFVRNIHTRIQPDRHYHAGGVRFQQADAERLGHIAGIFDLQHVRLAGIGDREGIGVPTGFFRASSRVAPVAPAVDGPSGPSRRW